jgi:transposase-like protein
MQPRTIYLWRAVDSEGEVLEILVQPRRDKAAAVRLLRKLHRRQGFVPTVIITDKLRSYIDASASSVEEAERIVEQIRAH